MNLTFFRDTNNYRYSSPAIIEEIAISDHSVWYLPVVVDTEYEHFQLDYNRPKASTEIQQTISCQVKHINADEGLIFTHPDCRDIARHSVMESECVVFDYLKALGYDVEVKRCGESLRYVPGEKYLHIDFFAHFAVAELFRIFQGEMRRDIQKLCLERGGKSVIKQGRRVLAENTYKSNVAQQWASLDKYLVRINGVDFRIRISIYDTIAILGQQSLATLAQLANHKMKYKDTLTKEEKEKMSTVYTVCPDAFDQYALGDLDVYDILLKIESKFRKIYADIGLSKFWKDGECLRMTIGATVAKLLENALIQHLGISDLKLLRALTKPGTTEVIKSGVTTAVYLGKVDGGRCRNNRPTDVRIESLICDIDINGCYGNGLRNQIYPIGTPILIGLPLDSENNKFPTLGEFIKYYGHDLVPGLWHARVSFREGYKPKYLQDFLASWYPPKDIKNLPTDSELEAVNWWTEDNAGTLKVVTDEIHLGLLNHDFLQLIEHVCSVRQRKELMDNLIVVSALYYPKSTRVSSAKELLHELNNHQGENTCKVKGKKKKQVITNIQECHAWYGVPLSELIVDKLMIERSKYSKKDEIEKQFNTLFKLLVNTIYGDQVSPYFEIGNACVGNNITARARAMAWYMEKGFHGFQTITDGCAFELNRVMYPEKKRLTTETVLNAYCKSSHDAHFKLQPLGNSEIKVISWEKSVPNYEVLLKQNGKTLSYSEIAENAMKHLQNLFPNVDVLHKPTKGLNGNVVKGQFTLEIKDVFDGASFHGSANYDFRQDGQSLNKTKMRSYSKDKRIGIKLMGGKLQVIDPKYSPANEMLKGIYENPHQVPIGIAFRDTSILKIGTFKQLFDSRYENSKVFPGCTIERVRIARLFSLNQFTFKSWEQFKSWEREYQRLIKKFGWSYEALFLNVQQTAVNYTEMVEVIDCRIRNGKMSFFSRNEMTAIMKGENHRVRFHPELSAIEKMREVYGIFHGFAIPDEDNEITSDEWVEILD